MNFVPPLPLGTYNIVPPPRYLFVALSGTVVCLLAVVYLPFLQWVFQTEALHLTDWLYLAGITSSVLVVSEIRKVSVCISLTGCTWQG